MEAVPAAKIGLASRLLLKRQVCKACIARNLGVDEAAVRSLLARTRAESGRPSSRRATLAAPSNRPRRARLAPGPLGMCLAFVFVTATHWWNRRMITNDERAIFTLYCRDHVVARCPQCHEDLAGSQVGADLIAARYDFCPSCRADLTDALRLHILACEAIRATLRGRVNASRDQIDASRALRKRSEELKTRSEILAAESEALIAQALAILRAR